MKTNTILSGLIVTGTIVSAGSIGLGVASKNKHLQKQNINSQIINTKKLTSAYRNTVDSLILKSQYEKVYLQSMNSFKKAIVNNDEKIKLLKNSTI